MLLNGITNSILATGERGGGVWLYSPGGLIVGPNGQFNVGSVLLTANTVIVGSDPATPSFANGSISVSSVTDEQARVEVQAGATINLTQAGSYLALVAPRVRMNGIATASGSVAYVAAEAVDITMDGELFDIAVSRGTATEVEADKTVPEHRGSTTGPADAGRGIDMVAVPRNDAITMLVSGTARYAPATGGSSDGNGVVVLSAGSDARATNETGYGVNVVFGAPQSPFDASLTLPSGTFTSATSASATTAIAGTTQNDVADPDGLVFRGDVTARAGRSIALAADDGASLRVDGSLAMTGFRGTARADEPALTIRAAGAGRVQVDGSLAMDATVEADGPATGGLIALAADGGAIGVGGNARLEANGNALGVGANGTGGRIALTATDGSLVLTGQTIAVADGSGGRIELAVGGTGAPPDGIARELRLGDAILGASGFGSDGGAGRGGTIALGVSAGALAASSVTAEANGFGGSGRSVREGTAGAGRTVTAAPPTSPR